MRVLWLALRCPNHPRAGGAERTILEIGSRLVQLGHEVILVAGRAPGEKRDELIRGINVVHVGTIVAPHVLYGSIMSRFKPVDVVIEDLAHVIPWVPRFFSSTARIAFFRHLHARTLDGQVPQGVSQLLKAVEKSYVVTNGDTPFVVESLQSRRDLVGLGIRQSMVEVIPPGVDSAAIRPLPKDSHPVFVYFSGMRESKRPHHALRAFAIASRSMPDARMTMFGEGPSLNSIRKLAKELGVSGRVTFPGKASSNELYATLGRAWVNVHSSLAEGWGYSIMEASAAGVPTAAYSVPGVCEVIRPGVNGVLTPDGDVEGLAGAMVSLAGLGPNLRISAHKWACQYDWERAASSWDRHLHKVAGLSGMESS